MTERSASRTLVKSSPELWAECSDASSLARHLGQFGEIKITRLEPETVVAWEGERVSGTVRLEPAGWGTRVTLTAREAGSVVAPAPAVAALPAVAVAGPRPDPPPAPPVPVAEAPEPPQPPRVRAAEPAPAGPLARLAAWFRRARAVDLREPPAPTSVAPGPAPPPATVVVPEPPAPPVAPPVVAEPEPELDPGAALKAALDSLGRAHHRPFSRA